ncbi:extensin family protein [Caldimonas tepidiphila]|uniref:extensin family protein n=1 Tax=Caldimonas tepidiphila TaxID=2315841 RepID=UPI000E5A5C83|nr:extensin family protein [Caldimonas tepidiphila]
MRLRTAFPLLLLILLGPGTERERAPLRLPDRWNPWAPLSVADEPNLLTRYKLARLGEDRALCHAALASAEIRHETLPDRITGEGCGFRDAVRIEATGLRIGKPLALSCPAAVALALWERHVLQPAAQGHFGRIYSPPVS